jgi:caa(3)-type oxidase subunit IV
MAQPETPPIRVWALLAGLTIVSAVIAERMHQPTIVIVSAFAFAVVKGQLVAVHFMETKRARAVWNGLYRSWIVAIGVLLLLGNLLAPHG